jgi:hypothetical protein
MKQHLLRLINLYYVVLVLTPIIYATRMYVGDWLEEETYFKIHGKYDDSVMCMLLPPFFIDIVLLTVVTTIFLWAKEAKSRVRNAKLLTSVNYFELLFIGMMVFFFSLFDIFLSSGMAELVMAYFKA